MIKFLNKSFNPGVWMTCFVIFFLPILLYLGYWQISRGFEKKAIWEAYSINKTLPPILEKELSLYKKEDLFYRSVIIQGSYINDSFLLDNRVYRSKKGYEIFTPFKSEDQAVYLVNRGWTNNYSDHPFKAPEGRHLIEGIISPFNKYGLNLSKVETEKSFPVVVQELTHSSASKLLGNNLSIEKVVLQLSAASKGSFEPIWGPTELKAPRHWGYAAQWLGLALVLVILYFYYGYKEPSKQ
tara:strand:- start:377 stop:1096 length:720 start_codon:yes stop_codon:yes gene_type:complete